MDNIINDKIRNIFDFISETELTEKTIYLKNGEYPVYSGQTSNKGIIGYLNEYKENVPCITFTTYGSAGKLFYREGQYTIGRNCMGLRPKDEYKNQINLKWFAYKFQGLFYKYRIGEKDGQKSLNMTLIKNVSINIPSKEIQNEQLAVYEKAYFILNEVNRIIINLDDFYDSKVEITTPVKTETIKNIFKICGGNSGLTEKFIYNNAPTNNEGILILSSATIDSKSLGFVPSSAKPKNKKLKVFEGPAILVARNGYAGTMRYIEVGSFTTNDHAYVMIPKKIWLDKINLRWFIYQYQDLFYNIVTSKSDNATFNKGYAEKQIVNIPDIKLQNKIANSLNKIDFLKNKLKECEKELNELVLYEII